MKDTSDRSQATPGPAPEPAKGASRSVATLLIRVVCFIVALATMLAHNAVGLAYYDGFWIPQGYGINHLLPEELAHSALFFFFGLVAGVFLVVALEGVTVSERDLARVRRLADSGRAVAMMVGLVVFIATLLIGRHVLGHAVITDDEHAYRFIAQTLRTGSLTAPSPGGDLEFFREQFVILTDRVRYGKYPIGHPLLLAAGQIVAAEYLVVPLVTALIAVPLFWLGAAVVGRPAAALALLLFALSPQVLLTGATLLSQPASAFCLVAGLACLLAAENGPRRGFWLGAAGACFGYGVLVRPLPGALFALMAAGYVAVKNPPVPPRRQAVGPWIAFGAPLVLVTGLMMLINRAQAGDAFVTGYHVLHAPAEGGTGILRHLGGGFAIQAMGLAGHLLRQNLWLFGWPISLAFCAFARRTPRVYLLWAMIGAAWLYRLTAPKQGVGVTGPLYLFEVAPLLCLLTADGMVQLATSRRLAGAGLVSGRRLAAVCVAGILVSLSMFLPVKLANLGRTAEAQRVLPTMIDEIGITNGLVFHNLAVPPRLGLSWAYFPRFNSPQMDDDVLFVMLQRDAAGLEKNLEFWKRRFPDRTAWYFGYFSWEPTLIPLEAYVHQESARADPSARRSPPGPIPGPAREKGTPR